MSSTLDPALVLERATEQAHQLLAPDATVLLVPAADGNGLRPAAARGIGLGPIADVVVETNSSARFAPVADRGGDDALSKRLRPTARLTVPIVAVDELRGLLVLMRLRGTEPFSPAELTQASVLADFAATTATNAHLFARVESLLAQARMRETERADLSRRVVSAEQDERRKLSLFLHDGPLQTMSGIAMMLDAVAEDTATATSRARSRCSRPRASGSAASFARCASCRSPSSRGCCATRGSSQRSERSLTRWSAATTWRSISTSRPRPALPPDDQVFLYQIVREAVQNAVKHAAPSRVSVSVSGGPEAGYDVQVRDDGTGFAAGPDDGLPHHGLASMRERAQILGAKLRVESVPGAGTTVGLHIAGGRDRCCVGGPTPSRRASRDLVAACESGVDLAGVLEAARRAASAAAGGAEAAAYAIADDGTNLRLVGGPGVDELAIPAEPEPHHVDGAWVVPLISARRTVGCLLVRAPAGARIARVRLVAGIAAQAVEVARLWEAVAGGASHDPLTGLPGHRSFDRVLARELSRAMRTGDSVAVGVVAVDGMAQRNEADGHAGRRRAPPDGRGVLRRGRAPLRHRVPPRRRRLRRSCCPAMEAEPARALIERLAAAFAASTGGATVSAGVAAFPANGDTQAELMRLATGALYWARRGGGGRVVAYDADVVEALSGEEHARRLERDTYERTLRALDAARGHSATARAVSDYAGHLAAELGFPPERADRLRMVAFLYDATAPGAEPRERARVAARVASSALDAEAAEWLEAPAAGGAERPARVAHHRPRRGVRRGGRPHRERGRGPGAGRPVAAAGRVRPGLHARARVAARPRRRLAVAWLGGGSAGVRPRIGGCDPRVTVSVRGLTPL